MRYSFAASLDLKGWYSQIPVGEELSRILGVVSISGYCVHRTLPQGFGEACHIAQAISTRLCAGLEPNIASLIYDNFLIVGANPTDLDDRLSRFRTNLAKCNVIENSDKENQGTSVEYCGMFLDLASKTFTVTASWSSKAAAALLDALALPEWTNELAYTVFGLCSWYLRIRRLPFCLMPPILSAQRLIGRRMARGRRWNDSFHPADALRAAVSTIHANLVHRVPLPWHAPKMLGTRRVVFTDASDWGWGVVVVEHDAIAAIYNAPWNSEERKLRIHIREFLAFYKALARCREVDLFLVDNTVVVNALVKGHSPRPDIDRLLRGVLTVPFFISYVPTSLNLADLPSRNTSLDIADLSEARRAVDAAIKPRLVDWSYAKEQTFGFPT